MQNDQKAVNYLHDAGFTILMDDFGSGYSLRPSILKDVDLDVKDRHEVLL